MSDGTKIQWTDATWTVTRGCSRVSLGCGGCYAERMAHRFSGKGMPFEGLTRPTKDGPRWTGDLRLVPEALDLPMRWRKPRRIFVNSMSDLFHPEVPDKFISAVFGVMAVCPQHTFQVLTKRPERMAAWFARQARFVATLQAQYVADGMPQQPDAHWYACQTVGEAESALARDLVPEEVDEGDDLSGFGWPLPNVWLGSSIENRAALARLDHLRATPAALRFLSLEPLLEDLGEIDLTGIGWVIVGGESGPGARPCDLAWIRSIVRQCREAQVPCFVKQLGAAAMDPPNGLAGHSLRVPDEAAPLVSQRLRDRKGGDPAEWPEDLRVREMPGEAR